MFYFTISINFDLFYSISKFGWVPEWLKGPVLKTGKGFPFVGSNPTPSAINCK